MNENIFIYLIQFIHTTLILYVVLCPFIFNNKTCLQINITLLFYFLFKWTINDEKARCGLTELEYYITGKEYEHGYIYKIIKPLTYIKEKPFNDILLIVVTLLLLLNIKITQNINLHN